MMTEDSKLVVEKYWLAYASKTEASLVEKTCWEQQSIDQGIASYAAAAVASLISGKVENPKQSETLSTHLVDNLVLGNIRVTIVAVESPSDLSEADITLIKEVARESLCLCILSVESNIDWKAVLDVNPHHATNVIPLFPRDIDALGKELCSIEALIEFKLYRRLVLGVPDQLGQYDPALFADFIAVREKGKSPIADIGQAISERGDDPLDWVSHPYEDRVQDALKAGRNCVISGSSSSGKTILAFQIGRKISIANGPTAVAYHNLRTVSAFPTNMIEKLLFQGKNALPEIVVLDDVQSSPNAAACLLTIGSVVRRCSTIRPPSFLILSWPEFVAEVIGRTEDSLLLTVKPAQIQTAIMNNFGNESIRGLRDQLVERFGDNILLLREASIEAGATGRIPSSDKLAEKIWGASLADYHDTEAAKKVALVVGTLGRYDLPTPAKFLQNQAQVDASDLSDLVKLGFLRPINEYYSLGHRSHCRLLTDWLASLGAWQLLQRGRSQVGATNVVMDFLTSLESGDILDTLRFLDSSIGVKRNGQLNKRAALIVEIWGSFNGLLERTERQQSKDPTWAMTPSSAMFAIQALAMLGKRDMARPSIEFLRRHCVEQSSSLDPDLESLSTVRDFEQIRERMRKEDLLISESGTEISQASADEIDFTRFHKTWFKGVFLCAEAAYNESSERLTYLATTIEAEVLENGAFYPSRVPWVTARVLMGLSACGRNLQNSEAVRRAVSWLLLPHEEGGARSGNEWHSGTGTWNSSLETTAMVLTAVVNAGVDPEDEALEGPRKALFTNREAWTAPGQELAVAFTLQAFLDTGGQWEDIVPEAQYLSKWAAGEAFWNRATLSAEESLKQSCDVAQIASNLIRIAWTAIRSDLQNFLDALDTGPTGDMSVDVVSEESEGASDISNRIVNFLETMRRISLNEMTVVGNYKRFEEKTRNALRKRASEIQKALVSNGALRQNFLIWAPPGSGKTFLIEEIARTESVEFVELNLAKHDAAHFQENLIRIQNSDHPILCLLDEIDAKEDQEWPYQTIFPYLDLNVREDRSGRNAVFVLIGSAGAGLSGLTVLMRDRRKGTDLLDRVPSTNHFLIPEMTLGDKLIISLTQLANSAAVQNVTFSEVEKFALYYILKNESLSSPRQLRELATRIVMRLPETTSEIMYDELFPRGDRQREVFWSDNNDIARLLAGSNLTVEL